MPGFVNVLRHMKGVVLAGLALATLFVAPAQAAPFVLTPPNNLTATVNGHSIILNWTDRASGESGYKIERAVTAPSGTFPFTEIFVGTVPNQQTFTDFSLIPGATYSYRVRAYVSSVADGPYSNVASVFFTDNNSTQARIVNTLSDHAPDTCTTSDCTLREALADVPEGGTVYFALNLSGTITLSRGELVVARDLTVRGPGAGRLAISGAGQSRVLRVYRAVSTVSGLTINNGGNVLLGGGIYNNGSLTVSGCAFDSNTVQSPAAAPANSRVDGGAIYNTGELAVSDCTFTQNQTLPSATTLLNSDNGGAIYSNVSLSVSNSSFLGNRAAWTGGAIYIYGGGSMSSLRNCVFILNSGGAGGALDLADGSLTVSGCTFNANSGAQFGGAILMSDYSPLSSSILISNSSFTGNTAPEGAVIRSTGNTYTIKGCTFADNYAWRCGGAISVLWGDLTVNSSTFSRNSTAYSGGAIYNNWATLRLNNNTFTGNYARRKGGSLYNNAGTLATVVTLRSNIFDDTDGYTPLFPPDPFNGSIVNIRGAVFDFGYNLARDFADNVLSNSTSKRMTSPKLGPLQNNGGLTKTHALLAGSPAIDAGGPTNTTLDQRGFPRALDGDGNGSRVMDIGAYEAPALPPPVFGGF